MAHMISIAAYKIQSPIEAPFRTFARFFRARQTRNQLRGLSAHQLSDIGIEYSDIETISRRA